MLLQFKDCSLASESRLRDLFPFCGLQHQQRKTEKAKQRQHKQFLQSQC